IQEGRHGRTARPLFERFVAAALADRRPGGHPGAAGDGRRCGRGGQPRAGPGLHRAAQVGRRDHPDPDPCAHRLARGQSGHSAAGCDAALAEAAGPDHPRAVLRRAAGHAAGRLGRVLGRRPAGGVVRPVHPAAAAGPRFARAGRRADGRPPGGGQAAVSADRAAHRRGAEAPPRRQGRGAGAHAAVPAPADGVTPEAENADAVLALKRGELIILPTETVYGLAADASNGEAVARIFEAKGRPRFNPLIAHVADAAAAERIAVFDAAARRLAEVFWPGPLTIVAPVRDRQAVCDLARAGLDTVAVRVPGHARAREILAGFGGPVVAPSANRSGRPSPTTFADALE